MGQAKNERKKKFSFRSIPTRPRIRNSKKIAKKFKKSKNIIVASFQAKMRRDRLSMREKKNSRSDPFQPDTESGIPKKCKKLKNIIIAIFRPGTGWERLRFREKKNSRSDPFEPDPEQGILGKQQKKLKKHQYGFFSNQSGTGEAENMREKKISF